MKNVTRKFDEHNNEVYNSVVRDDGTLYEVWVEYDNNKNMIHYKNSLNFEMWFSYDDTGTYKGHTINNT